MARFVKVEPDDVPNFREGHRGRVSYPLLKEFLETGFPMAMLDRNGIKRSAYSLSMTLGLYIKNHRLPIKLFTRKGEIYLVRTDLDEDGNPKTQDLEVPEDDDPDIDEAEVERRAAERNITETQAV